MNERDYLDAARAAVTQKGQDTVIADPPVRQKLTITAPPGTYDIKLVVPGEASELQRLLSDVQVRDVLELRCEDGTWTANLDLECPSCKGPAQTAWVEAATLPDMLVALVRSVKEHRARLALECAGEGHR